MSEKQRSRTDQPYSGGGCENRNSCDKQICDKDRRRLLGALATGGSLALAGCTGVFAADSDTEPAVEYDIDYLQQDQRLQVKTTQTVLGAGLDSGLDLPYSCNAGFCGVCLSRANGDARRLVDMRVNNVDGLNEDAVRAGYFLPCTSQPREHFKLDTSVGRGDLQQFQEEDDDEDDEADEDDENDVPSVPTHAVDYVNQRWTIEVPEDQNLLEAGEDRGFDLPYQCRVGNCGQCLAQADTDASDVVEMTANNYGPLDDDAIEDGYFLTCTGLPRGEFELESDVYGELDD